MPGESVKLPDLTLRDLLALTAMHAQVSSRSSLGMLTKDTAEKAYKMADAMLAARNEPQ